MSKTVNVQVATDTEAYPVLSIRYSEDSGMRNFEIPTTLLDALEVARDAVEAIEVAIMTHIGERHPEAKDIADWLQIREDDAALEAAQGAYAVEHPGAEWQLVPVAERHRRIEAARAVLRG